jgi:sirohydrochlorin cobaltochelatase
MSQSTPHLMRGIVLFAHGSRDPLWHKPVEAVALAVRHKEPGALVACAYLEWSTPTLEEACQSLIAQGAQEISILPLFLGVGKHARQDLPELVAQMTARWPNIAFQLQAAVGENARLVALLADIALE